VHHHDGQRLSVPLFLEYKAVLKRPERQAVHGLSSEGTDTFTRAQGNIASMPFSPFRRAVS